MAQQPSNPRIDELRGRLRADPKSRLFYPLAEELRKIGHFDEAEKALRDGLAIHSTYLSAWISLGRVLKETGKYREATEVLGKALQLDMGNVVAARLAAESYLALGEKIEAVKKFKLVRALMPGDPATEEQIEVLERELHPEEYADVPPSLVQRPGPAGETQAEVSEADEAPFAEATPFEEVPVEPSTTEVTAPFEEAKPFPFEAPPSAGENIEQPMSPAEPVAIPRDEGADVFETASPVEFDDSSKVAVFPRPATIEREAPEATEEATAFEGEEPVSKYGAVVEEPEAAATEPAESDYETMIGGSALLTGEPAVTFEEPAPLSRETVEMSAPRERAEVVRRLNGWLAKVGRSEAGNV